MSNDFKLIVYIKEYFNIYIYIQYIAENYLKPRHSIVTQHSIMILSIKTQAAATVHRKTTCCTIHNNTSLLQTFQIMYCEAASSSNRLI